MSKIGVIEQEHFVSLQKNRKELMEKYSAGTLNISEEKVVEEIYKKKNVEGVSGKEAEKLYSKIKEDSKRVGAHTSKLIESYGETVRDITAKMVELKTMVYESYAKGIELESKMMSE